ncbi:MAG: magnesium transporter CorA family protein [Bacilli bacterium]|nr:magnesium transporter CorA family protein [Bacilli bacterium]
MIKIYKTNTNGEIEKLKKIEPNSWINLSNPNFDEIKEVIEKTKISESLLLKVLDYEELPRIETEDKATLIVVDVPYVEDKKSKNKYSTVPVGIITKGNYFLTVCLKETEIFNDFKHNKIKGVDTAKKTRFIIQLLLKIANFYIKYLNLINREIENKEKSLIKSTSNKELLNLMHIQKSLVYFVTSLKANDIILEKLSKGNIINMYEEDLVLLDDAMIESKQGIETANIYREILASMSDTYASIINNNLNGIMKFLAGITIVLSIPTMISSFMGMNVPMGNLSDNPFAFIIILIISILISIIIALILKKKDML